ncbi:hypothetical protein [Variovorax sp. 3P27G3]|jgi:hypothetical protein|uniref:hypothetical protein n=1 Tax=Variovorax sp. 3P27G3 TaxID=2502214 RepID=UPI0010F57B63|nr:hypothetical protein [Variovorax sp. 3P27G3]
MEAAIRCLGMAVCALVLMACICRIDLMRFHTNRAAWFAMYLLFAVYALGVLLDLLAARPVDWYEGAGVGGVLLYMALTRKLWRQGPPAETETGGLRKADGSPL